MSQSESRARARVFRRRRAVLAFAFLGVVAVGLSLWTRVTLAQSGVSESPSPLPSSAASFSAPVSAEASTSSASGSASASTSGDGIPSCESDALTVVAVTDKSTYSEGEFPVFTIQLTNSGDVECSVNVGTSQLSLTVTSGDTTIWRSADCATGSADSDEYWDYVKVVEPGETLESVGVTWDRVFSDASSCDASAESVTAGGAAYWLSASVGEVTSSDENMKQFFLY